MEQCLCFSERLIKFHLSNSLNSGSICSSLCRGCLPVNREMQLSCLHPITEDWRNVYTFPDLFLFIKRRKKEKDRTFPMAKSTLEKTVDSALQILNRQTLFQRCSHALLLNLAAKITKTTSFAQCFPSTTDSCVNPENGF